MVTNCLDHAVNSFLSPGKRCLSFFRPIAQELQPELNHSTSVSNLNLRRVH